MLLLLMVIERHVHGALAYERAMIGRHVAEIVHDDEHLDDSAIRIEESALYGALVGHAISALAAQRREIDDAEVGRGGDVLAHLIEGRVDGQRGVLGKERAAGANLGVEAVHHAHRIHAPVEQRLLEAAQQRCLREQRARRQLTTRQAELMLILMMLMITMVVLVLVLVMVMMVARNGRHRLLMIAFAVVAVVQCLLDGPGIVETLVEVEGARGRLADGRRTRAQRIAQRQSVRSGRS